MDRDDNIPPPMLVTQSISDESFHNAAPARRRAGRALRLGGAEDPLPCLARGYAGEGIAYILAAYCAMYSGTG